MPTPEFKFHFHEDGYREELLDAFHLAYGQFIRQFGQTESTLSYHLEEFLLRLYGDKRFEKDIFRALLGSRRTPDLANVTKLCLEAAIRDREPYQKDDLDEVTELYRQVAEIRFLRDRMVHHAIHPGWRRGQPVYFRILNRYAVNNLEKTQEILLRIEDLEAATEDLKTVCIRLPRALWLHDHGGQGPLQPWLYKPSQLIRSQYQEP